MQNYHLTKCELEVMNVVWDKGAASVQDVVDSLERPLAYTTVMTTLKILDEKRGAVRKTKQGRAYIYEPAVAREDVRRSMAGELTETLFSGSLKSLVLSLMDPKSVSDADVQELKAAIAELERTQGEQR
ncbi:BlaI/MecI/CopY family transcriptional regulator [Symmachiella dynata]|uniref:BlaI/MecI/CopY family transcriptional regulator n=1 Tax=Symmachiella dynata TaxID=2527995 RepID=UPI0030EE5CC8